MKKEIQMILNHFEKDNDLIIINNNNFELFNILPKIKSINRLHVNVNFKYGTNFLNSLNKKQMLIS